MFEILKTGIDGLDSLLGGGIRYPSENAAFLFITGGPGTGKTLLALEMVTRAWLGGDDGSTYLYYSVEHSPDNLYKKLETDFEFYGHQGEVRALEQVLPNRLCLEAQTPRGTSRLVLTHAIPASMQTVGAKTTDIDVEWILAEVGNYKMAGPVQMVCLDNVGLLLTDLDYYGKRKALLATRRSLMAEHIHGIFVQEDTGQRDLRIPSAEEFSTDLLITLGFGQESDFKVRSIEILKARQQYYYRGKHHFSIAGKGTTRDVYLGARNERGPGIHIYPSVAAQLSIARDRAQFRVPRRGEDPIDLGHPALGRLFPNGQGPGKLSSTVLLAEPGAPATDLALRFLAAGRARGEAALMVSTQEDRDALATHCRRDPHLAEFCLKPQGRGFAAEFRLLYLHPEFISAGKFTWDIVRLADGGHGGPRVARMAFDNIFRLQNRFPLITHQEFLVPALLDLLRYHGVTPFFVDLVPPGSADPGSGFDPSPAMTVFDNVLYVYRRKEGGHMRTWLQAIKGTGTGHNDEPVPLEPATG